jgi:hypothetical protein
VLRIEPVETDLGIIVSWVTSLLASCRLQPRQQVARLLKRSWHGADRRSRPSRHGAPGLAPSLPDSRRRTE